MKEGALITGFLCLVTCAMHARELVSVEREFHGKEGNIINSSLGFSFIPFLSQIITFFLILKQTILIAETSNFKLKNTKTLAHLNIYQRQLIVNYAHNFSQLSKSSST